MEFKIGQKVIINSDDYIYLEDRCIENGSVGIITDIITNPHERYKFRVSVCGETGTFAKKELLPYNGKATII